MKRSVSNVLLTSVGILGDVMWYVLLGYYFLVLTLMFMPSLLQFRPEISIPFNNLEIKLRIIANLLFFLGYAFIAIIIYYLRLLLKNISQKQFFSIKNYKYLRVMGITLILINILSYPEGIIFKGIEYYIRPDLSLSENIVLNFYFMKIIILGIIILALAEVFRNGALMHDEQQLTV